ncbi:MAG: hypothetical protein IPP63_18860 [Chloracidobacterium sp.]|nr:hypothetical protein [Chloracidobacterium sp.]
MTSAARRSFYYGDEIATKSGGDPENRRDFLAVFRLTASTSSPHQEETRWKKTFGITWLKLGKLRQTFEPLPPRQNHLTCSTKNSGWRTHAGPTRKQLWSFSTTETKPATVTFDVSMIKQTKTNGSFVDRFDEPRSFEVKNGSIKCRAAGLLCSHSARRNSAMKFVLDLFYFSRPFRVFRGADKTLYRKTNQS